MSQTRELVMVDLEITEVLNNIFASVSPGKFIIKYEMEKEIFP